MARRINKPVVISVTLLTFFFAIVLAAVLLRRVQQRDPQHFVRLAERHKAHQEWRQAALFYSKAWDRSDDPEMLVAFGEMALQEGELRLAMDAWRRALVRQPDLVSAHRSLIKLLMDLAGLEGTLPNWREVRDWADRFLAIDPQRRSPQDQAYALYALGLSRVKVDGHDAAGTQLGIEALEQAAALAPEVPDYSLGLAAVLADRGRWDEAEKTYKELMTRFASPGAEATKVRVAYGRTIGSARKKDYADAYRLFDEALTLAGAVPATLKEARLGYAAFLAREWARQMRGEAAVVEKDREPFVEAERLLGQCIEADVDSFDAHVQLATLYSAAGLHEKVIGVVEGRMNRPFSRKGLEAFKNRVGAFQLNMLASDACIALAVPSAGDATTQESWLVRAEKAIADAKGEYPSHPRIAGQSGKVKLARGQDRPALEDLREADAGYKLYGTLDWQNKILLARVHIRLGEVGAARSVLEDVAEVARVQRPTDAPFWLVYGQTLLLNNELDRALEVADRLLTQDSGNADAKQLKAAILERKGRPEEAGRLYEEVTGSGVVKTLLRFRELDQAGHSDEALQFLRTALRDQPAEPRWVAAAALKLIELERHDEAAALVNDALSRKPQDVTLKKLAILTRPGLSPDARDAALREAIDAEPDAFQRTVQRAALCVRRGATREALEQLVEAEQHLQKKDTPLARQSSTAVYHDLLVQMLRLAAEVKDDDRMRKSRDAAAAYNVDGAEGKSVLGLYHLLRDETELGIAALRAAVEAQPTDAQTQALLGHALVAAGKNEDAKAVFDRAVRANPNEVLARRGLAGLAHQRGDTEAYEVELAACRRLAPSDPWVQAETVARNEQSEPAAAIARREKRLAEKPDDADNLRRLAWLSETTGNQEKADRYYSRWVELRSDDEGAALSLAKYFRRSGRPDRALEALTRFAQTRTTPESKAKAQILIAGHYVNQENARQAESTLLAAVQTADTLDVREALAELYLRQGTRPEDALKWCDAAIETARREKSPRLSALMAARIACLLNPQINDVELARQAVEELRRAFPDDVSGLYWDSEVHARQGDIEKAVETLTGYLQKTPDDAHALSQRSRLFLSLGRPAQAIADLEQIKRTQPLALDLEPRIVLAQIHWRAGRTPAAILELERLVQDAPNSSKAHEELIRAYLKAVQWADADRAATAQINRLRAEPDARWFFLRARALLDGGEIDRSLADVQRAWQLSASSAESFWTVLDLYRRAGRFAEGAEFYRKNATAGAPPPNVQSLAAVLMARAGAKTEAVEQFRLAMSQALLESFSAVRTVSQDVAGAFPSAEALALFEALPADSRWIRANDRILVQLHRSAGRIDDAVTRLEQLTASARDDTERAGLAYELGEILQLAGRMAPAQTAYEQAIQYDSRNWPALNNLAFLLSESFAKHDEALRFAKQAVSIKDTADTVDTLGWVYLGMGDSLRAIAELSRAVRLDPSQPQIMVHLGEAYRRAGRFHEAEDVLVRTAEAARVANDVELVARVEQALTRTRERNRQP